MAETQTKSENQGLLKGGFNLKDTLITTGLVLVLLGVVVLLYFAGLRFSAERNHQRAIQALSNNNIQKAQLLEGKAINLAGFEDRYYRALSRIYLAQVGKVMNNNELDQTQKRKQVQGLVSAISQVAQRAKALSPRNVTNYTNLGVIYQSLMSYGVQGAEERAIKAYQGAINLAPANPELHFQLARIYIAKAGNTSKEQKQISQQSLEKAMSHLKDAIELRPNYWSAHYQQAIVYNRQGKIEEAVQKLTDLKQANPADQSAPFQLGALYLRNGDWSKAEQEFKEALEINSEFANARYFLGLVYDQQGEKQKAIKQFEKIASLNKTNKKQVQPILENLQAGKPALGETGTPEEVPDLEEGAATSSAATSTKHQAK